MSADGDLYDTYEASYLENASNSSWTMFLALSEFNGEHKVFETRISACL